MLSVSTRNGITMVWASVVGLPGLVDWYVLVSFVLDVACRFDDVVVPV